MKPLAKIIVFSVLALLLLSLLAYLLIFDVIPVFHIGSFYSDRHYTVINANGEAALTDAISGIDIDWSDKSVRICAYEGKEILLRETVRSKEKDRLRYRISDGVLSIHEYASGLFSGFKGKELVILLPVSCAQNLDRLEINVSSAAVTLEGLSAQRLTQNASSGALSATDCDFRQAELDSSSGSVTLSSCTVDDLEIDTASGGAALTGSYRRVEFDSASGDLILDSSTPPNHLSIETASGDATLTLPKESGFSLEFDTASGELDISEFVGSFSFDRFVCGDGLADFEMNSASGDLTLHAK